MNRLTTIFVFLFFCEFVFAENDKWILERSYKDNKLFLHALINYQPNLYWQYNWEKNRVMGNGFRMSVGSVSTNDLLIDGYMVINQDLGSGWYFLSELKQFNTRHHNSDEAFHFIGFEKMIFGSTSAFLLVDPSFDKEFTDIQIGLSLTGNKRENYLRISLALDDFFYDSKNNLGGKTTLKAIGLKWLLRYEKNKWCIISEGNYTPGFKRNYKDPVLSPLINFHRQQVNEMKMKLYYHLTEASIFEFNFNHYRFLEEKKFYQLESNYRYTNDIYNVSIKKVYRINSNNRLNLQGYMVWKDAESRDYRAHKYDRDEILYAVFYDLILGKNTVTLGYLSSDFSFDYNTLIDLPDYSKDEYVQKVFFGWTWEFNQNTRFQVSLSHELNLNSFGGGSVQYIMLF